MGRKAAKHLLLVLLLLLIGGCGFKDIDKRFFVVAIAVDPSENPGKRYKVTIKLAIPSPSERFGSNKFVLLSEDADSIAEGVRIMKSKVDKELDFGHAKMILFGQDLVQKRDMKEIIDWFVRRRDFQDIAWVGIAKPDGKSVLNLGPPTERLPSNMLFLAFGQSGTETAYIVSEYLFDFRRRLTDRGIDPILPVIEPRGDQQVKINTVGVFDKSSEKLVLTPVETKIFNTFYQRMGKYDIYVPQGNDFFLISAENVGGTFSIKDQDGLPVIRVNMKVIGGIEDSNMKLSKQEIPQYEQLAQKVIQARVINFLTKLQKAGVDPIGFGLRYRARHFGGEAVWQKWKQLYPKAQFDVHVRVSINSTGALG